MCAGKPKHSGAGLGFSTQTQVTLALPLESERVRLASRSRELMKPYPTNVQRRRRWVSNPWGLRTWVEAVTPVGSTGGRWLQSRLGHLLFHLVGATCNCQLLTQGICQWPASKSGLVLNCFDWSLAVHIYVLSWKLVMAWNPANVWVASRWGRCRKLTVTIEIVKRRVKWPIVRHPARCNRSERVLAGKLWSYCARSSDCANIVHCERVPAVPSCLVTIIISLSPSPRVPILPSLQTSTKKSRCIVLPSVAFGRMSCSPKIGRSAQWSTVLVFLVWVRNVLAGHSLHHLNMWTPLGVWHAYYARMEHLWRDQLSCVSSSVLSEV